MSEFELWTGNLNSKVKQCLIDWNPIPIDNVCTKGTTLISLFSSLFFLSPTSFPLVSPFSNHSTVTLSFSSLRAVTIAWCILPVVEERSRQQAPDDGATRRVRCCMIEADPDTRSMLMIYPLIVRIESQPVHSRGKTLFRRFSSNPAVGSVTIVPLWHRQKCMVIAWRRNAKWPISGRKLMVLLYCAAGTACVMK